MRSATNNGEKDRIVEEGLDTELLGKEEATLFRAMAARMNFLSLDCPDLQFPVKGCAREMAGPRRGSFKQIKRAVRYLVDKGRVDLKFPWREEPSHGHVAADSDWGRTEKDKGEEEEEK